MGYEKIKSFTKNHEGLVLKPYKDSVGVLTIGYGHNLEAHGISKVIATLIFEQDFYRAKTNAERIPVYWDLDEIRRCILIDMVFNLGYAGVMKFKKMLKALRNKDFMEASKEMLDSRWADQVGTRANELSIMMIQGEWIE